MNFLKSFFCTYFISQKEMQILKRKLFILQLEQESCKNLQNARFFLLKGKIECLEEIINLLEK